MKKVVSFAAHGTNTYGHGGRAVFTVCVDQIALISPLADDVRPQVVLMGIPAAFEIEQPEFERLKAAMEAD